MKNKELSRRKFLINFGFTLGAGFISSSFIKNYLPKTKEDCERTPIVEMGPFAVMKYRKQADHDIDLTQINDHSGVAFGEIITVFGKITDKNCHPIPSAIVEIWSANHYGKYHHEYDKSERKDDENFQGWGQAITNNKGEYSFKTIIPGPYGARTRHIHFKVSKRNYHELTSQLFFEGEEKNKKDPILNLFSHEEQQLLIRPIETDQLSKKVTFNMVLDEVKTGVLPEKVLKEYTGNYLVKNAPFDLKNYMKTVMGIEINNLDFTISQHKDQLYMIFSFYPKIELGWSEKDIFQSWSFSNSYLKFSRNATGKVIGLKLHLSEDQYVDAIKK